MEVDSDTGGSEDQFGPSDEETVTAYEVLQKLTQGWLNEKLAPELLVPLTGEVECMMEQLKQMESNLARLPPRDEIVKHHQLEIERVRYLVSSYLRTRLGKIQKYAWHVRDEENKRRQGEPSRLTAEENKFLKEYLDVFEGHLSNVALSNMPGQLRALHPERVRIVPNKDTFVFFRVKRGGSVVVEDAEGRQESTVDLPDGSQFIMKYQPVSDLVNCGDVQLV